MKTRKRRALPALLMALLLMGLTACGGSSSNGGMSASQSAPAAGDIAPEVFVEEYGWAEDAADAPTAPEGEPDGTRPDSAKMIYTADLMLESKTFDEAVRALDKTVEELGGWYESRGLEGGSGYRVLTGTIRVPVERFRELLERAGEAAHVTSCQEQSQDVSEAYYDSEARLTTQRTKLERLQMLLSQAESMEDIIAIESAISDTELEIEYLTGSLRHYDSLIGYSTVTVHLWEVYRLSTDEEAPLTFGSRFAAALTTGFQRGVENLEDFTIALAQNWMTLLVWAVVIVAAVVAVRRYLGKRRQKKITQALEKAAHENAAAAQTKEGEQQTPEK